MRSLICLRVQIVFERLLGQLNDFVVRGKAQTDQLIFAEPVDLRVPLGGRKSLQAEALFEADDAVLHLERIAAQPEKKDNRGDRQHH